mgnify:CR=1
MSTIINQSDPAACVTCHVSNLPRIVALAHRACGHIVTSEDRLGDLLKVLRDMRNRPARLVRERQPE